MTTRAQEQEARRQARIAAEQARRDEARRQKFNAILSHYSIRYLDIAVISGIVSFMFWFAYGVFT